MMTMEDDRFRSAIEKSAKTIEKYIEDKIFADMQIDPIYRIDRSAKINTKQLYARPGRFYGLDDPLPFKSKE